MRVPHGWCIFQQRPYINSKCTNQCWNVPREKTLVNQVGYCKCQTCQMINTTSLTLAVHVRYWPISTGRALAGQAGQRLISYDAVSMVTVEVKKVQVITWRHRQVPVTHVQSRTRHHWQTTQQSAEKTPVHWYQLIHCYIYKIIYQKAFTCPLQPSDMTQASDAFFINFYLFLARIKAWPSFSFPKRRKHVRVSCVCFRVFMLLSKFFDE